MSFGINKVMVGGNLTKDVELTYTTKGVAVAKFTIAANRSYKDGSGDKQETVEFCNITAFGKQAEVIAEYMKKGKPLLVEGRLQTDTWEDKDDVKHWRTGIILEGFHFLGGGKDNADDADDEPKRGILGKKHGGKTRHEDPPDEREQPRKGKSKSGRKGHDYSEDADPDWTGAGA